MITVSEKAVERAETMSMPWAAKPASWIWVPPEVTARSGSDPADVVQLAVRNRYVGSGWVLNGPVAKAPDRGAAASAPPPPPREASVGCAKNSDTLPSKVALAPIVTLTLSPKTGTVNQASAKSPDSG